jgi:hypothetical protein
VAVPPTPPLPPWRVPRLPPQHSSKRPRRDRVSRAGRAAGANGMRRGRDGSSGDTRTLKRFRCPARRRRCSSRGPRVTPNGGGTAAVRARDERRVRTEYAARAKPFRWRLGIAPCPRSLAALFLRFLQCSILRRLRCSRRRFGLVAAGASSARHDMFSEASFCSSSSQKFRKTACAGRSGGNGSTARKAWASARSCFRFISGWELALACISR